jgi:hypothetical protein
LQWQHDGGFGGSSENIHVDPSGVLRADCRQENGSLYPASINLNEKIANMDGKLYFHP